MHESYKQILSILEKKAVITLLLFSYCGYRVSATVSNATFNIISVISWWSVLLVEETRVPGENHRLAPSH